MNYNQVIKYLENLEKFPENIVFERIKCLLKKLNNPEQGVKFIHIGGTNGKGSVSAMIDSILRISNKNVGLFTSPHLFKYNERIQVGGLAISDDDFVKYFMVIKKVADEMINKNCKMQPSLFEILFVISLLYFNEKNIDIGVIEVGLGGRLDPTNIIKSKISIITNIDLEHTHILGSSKLEIAKEKAGIIKNNSICITTETDKKLINIFAEKCKKVGSKLIVLEETDIDIINQTAKGQVFNFMNYNNVELKLLGDHQLKNAALAITCSELLGRNPLEIKNGIKNVKWPLRMEIVNLNPTILIDGAHTKQAVQSVLKTVNQLWENERKILIIGFSENKKWKKMIHMLIGNFNKIIITSAKYKGINPIEIQNYIMDIGYNSMVVKNTNLALDTALQKLDKNDMIIVLGGIYLGAEIKKLILDKKSYAAI